MITSLEITAFIPPNGRTETVTLHDLDPGDVSFLLDHNVKISMESIPSLGYVLYADIGRTINNDPDEDPDELLVFSNGKSAKDTLHELKLLCEKELTCQ